MREIGEPKLNQWYFRQDTGEKFLVMDYDEDSATVEIQTADGDLDELDQEVWETLPLSFAEAPHDWTIPIDIPDLDDRDDVEKESDGGAAQAQGESWEDPSSADDFDRYTERLGQKDLDS
jgi:hypothetical protein